MASTVLEIIKGAGYSPIRRVSHKNLPVDKELHGVRKDSLKGGFFYWATTMDLKQPKEVLIQVYNRPQRELYVITSRGLCA